MNREDMINEFFGHLEDAVNGTREGYKIYEVDNQAPLGKTGKIWFRPFGRPVDNLRGRYTLAFDTTFQGKIRAVLSSDVQKITRILYEANEYNFVFNQKIMDYSSDDEVKLYQIDGIFLCPYRKESVFEY